MQTTVLFPFAPCYQEGFFCPATADGKVDPEECEVLSDVTLLEDSIHVPLPPVIFRIEPGSTIRIHKGTSGSWYFTVSTTLDETAPGRPINVSSPAEADSSTPEPEEEPTRSKREQNQETNHTAPEEDLQEALGGTVLVLGLGLAVLGLVRRRVDHAQ